MSDLQNMAAMLVDRARGDESLEAFVTHSRDFTVKAYGGEVESLSSAEPRGAGVRIIDSERVGFAHTTVLSERGLDEVVAAARENAQHASADPAVALAPAWDASPPDIAGLIEESQENVEPDTKVAFALDLERITRTFDPRIRTVEEALYSDSISEVAIATSTGISGAYRRTDAWCYSLAIATEGDETQIGFEFDLARSLGNLDAEQVATRAAERALATLGATKVPSARMPILLDPYTAGQFLGVIASALTGEAVQKGRSLFAGRIDEAVADAKVTLIDDGRVEGAPGSSPWDAEGVPTQRTLVIENGVLRSFLYDLTSANREGRESTGNASRAGFKSGPGPSPSNMAFEPTGEKRDELLHRADRALLVHDFHGVHSGTNPVSGDFSVGVTGHLVENGTITKPVKEVTIAAPMLDILSRIEGVADDQRWLPFGGSYGGATTLISEMTVAGS
ncbi:MAG: TldD/PmbA family protein [Actinomycetota bacterium]